MADRSSAELFGYLFEYLASHLDDPYYCNFCIKMANDLWKMSLKYDFHPLQMGCNEALFKFGFVRQAEDEDGEDVWIYKGLDF